MEFNISSAELLKGLMNVSKAVPAKTALPILENFLFEINDDMLVITASDQELTLRSEVRTLSVEQGGSIAVPSRQMLELLKTLPDRPISILTVSESTFELSWSSGKSTLPFFPAEDYPEITGTAEDTTTVTFPAASLLDGISGTIYATADDEMRPTMNGIFFDFKTEGVTFVASDSHKLICYTVDDVKVEQSASFILHKKPAGVLKSIIDKDTETVDVSFDGTSAEFSFGSTKMICRLLVGKYPKYVDVIPKNNSNVLKIDRELLLGTIRRVSVCANKASNHIKFTLSPGQLEITAQDLGFALAAYEKIECDYNGMEISAGFKSSFLIEILSNMGCESIVMKFMDGKKAVLLTPSEEEAKVEKMCGIIMPIMV